MGVLFVDVLAHEEQHRLAVGQAQQGAPLGAQRRGVGVCGEVVAVVYNLHPAPVSVFAQRLFHACLRNPHLVGLIVKVYDALD